MDRSQLSCGILQASLSSLKSGLPDLAVALRKILSGQGMLVDLYRQRKDELQILLYHAPFRDTGISYGLRTRASREVPGGSSEWKEWLPQWTKFHKTSRSLRAEWSQFESSRFILSMITSSTSLAGEASISFQRRSWDNSYSPEFRQISHDAVRTFAYAIGLENDQLERPSNADRLSVAVPDSVGTVPSVWLRHLETKDCFRLFESSLHAFSNVLGVADCVSFGVDLAIDNVEEAFASLKNVPQVWSHYQTDWIPHSTDIYALPLDADFVRAYPVLTVHYKNVPKLCFQINLVHARGESFIECQVYEDKKWFDILSQFFEAPIDIWKGPLESRFGWYGDANDGRIVRHETSPERLIGTKAEVAKAAPKQVKAFLLLPLGVDYGGPNHFYIVDVHERYEDPVGIFKSRSAAVKFAKDNPDAILGNRELYDIILALAGEDFSFGPLPVEARPKLRDLLEIDEQVGQDRGARNFKMSIDLEYNSQEVLEVLGENAYRILEMRIEEDEFRMLQSRLKAGRFNMKLRYKIAKLFDLDFAEWQLEGYFSDNELEGEESD